MSSKNLRKRSCNSLITSLPTTSTGAKDAAASSSSSSMVSLESSLASYSGDKAKKQKSCHQSTFEESQLFDEDLPLSMVCEEQSIPPPDYVVDDSDDDSTVLCPSGTWITDDTELKNAPEPPPKNLECIRRMVRCRPRAIVSIIIIVNLFCDYT